MSGEHASQCIGEVVLGVAAIRFAHEPATQAVVGGVAGVITRSIVDVLLQPEGVDRQARPTAGGAALEDTLTPEVVGVPLLAAAARVPLHQVVEHVVGERRRLAVVRSGGDVAPGVVA